MMPIEIVLKRRESNMLNIPLGCTVICAFIPEGQYVGKYEIYYCNKFVGMLDLEKRGYNKIINEAEGIEAIRR